MWHTEVINENTTHRSHTLHALIKTRVSLSTRLTLRRSPLLSVWHTEVINANTTHHNFCTLSPKPECLSTRLTLRGPGKSPLLSVWHTEVIKDDFCQHPTPQPHTARSQQDATGKVQADRLPLPRKLYSEVTSDELCEHHSLQPVPYVSPRGRGLLRHRHAKRPSG